MPDLQPSEVSSSVWQSMDAARRRRRRGQNWMTMRGERDAVLVVSDDTFSSSMRCLPCLFSVATDRSFAVFFLVHIAIWYFPAHVHIARMLSLSLSLSTRLPLSVSFYICICIYIYICIRTYVHRCLRLSFPGPLSENLQVRCLFPVFPSRTNVPVGANVPNWRRRDF